jgi:hypothetical protein
MMVESIDILEAATINCHACDFCDVVHVDFYDVDGTNFATASVPRHNWEPFIARFRHCMAEIDKRPRAAPARKQ